MFGIKVRSHGPAKPPAGKQAGPFAVSGTDVAPALLPVPAVSFQAWQSRGPVHGAPGTQRIPAPAPFPGYDRNPVTYASEGIIGMPSSEIPYWYPQVWYQVPGPELAFNGQYLNSSHEMPVPAIRPNNYTMQRGTNQPGGISPQQGSFTAQYGRWPIGWPRIAVSYPPVKGT
jgi:hypothetical protein